MADEETQTAPCHPHIYITKKGHPTMVRRDADHKRWARVKARRIRAHASRKINQRWNK